jgi:hypothetical protein
MILFPFVLSIVDYLKYIQDSNLKVITIEKVFLSNWPFLSGALILFLIQYSRLRLTTIKTTISEDELKNIITQLAINNDWKIRISNNQMIQASVKGLFNDLAFVGEMVTVLFAKDQILINSICDPNEAPNLISFGKNKRHKKLIINTIKKCQCPTMAHKA